MALGMNHPARKYDQVRHYTQLWPRGVRHEGDSDVAPVRHPLRERGGVLLYGRLRRCQRGIEVAQQNPADKCSTDEANHEFRTDRGEEQRRHEDMDSKKGGRGRKVCSTRAFVYQGYGIRFRQNMCRLQANTILQGRVPPAWAASLAVFAGGPHRLCCTPSRRNKENSSDGGGTANDIV